MDFSGTDTEDGQPDFNCATFECDRDDCVTGCVASPDHDRVNLIVDAGTAANYGDIAAMGEVWWAKFDAVVGETYSFVGVTGNQTQDLVPGADGTWLTVTLKDASGVLLGEYEVTTPKSIVASDPCVTPHCSNQLDPATGLPGQTGATGGGACDLDAATDGTAGENRVGRDLFEHVQIELFPTSNPHRNLITYL